MQFLLSHCHTTFTEHQGVLLTLFLGGLVGGFTHCAGMCGPFVMAQTQHTSSFHLKKLSGILLLPYHLGRMTTYVLLGAIAALLSRQIMDMPAERFISALFLVLAGLIFILTALPQAKQGLLRLHSESLTRFATWLGTLSKPLFHNTSAIKGYALGVLLGFLPCGLIFAALMVVSTTGNPFTAATAMALFTLGTVPSLFLVGISGQLAYRYWPRFMQMTARGIMVINGISLFMLAGNIIL